MPSLITQAHSLEIIFQGVKPFPAAAHPDGSCVSEVSTTQKFKDLLEIYKSRNPIHLQVRIGFEHFSCGSTQQRALKTPEKWQMVFLLLQTRFCGHPCCNTQQPLRLLLSFLFHRWETWTLSRVITSSGNWCSWALKPCLQNSSGSPIQCHLHP